MVSLIFGVPIFPLQYCYVYDFKDRKILLNWVTILSLLVYIRISQINLQFRRTLSSQVVG